MKNKFLISFFILLIASLIFVSSKSINAQQDNQANLIGEFSFSPSGEGFLLKWSAPQANFCFPIGEMWTNNFSSSGQQMVYPQVPTTYYLYCFNNRNKVYQIKEVTITEKDLTPKIKLAVIPEKLKGLGDTVFIMLYILRKGDIKYCSAIDFYKNWQSRLGAKYFLANQKVDVSKTIISAIVKPVTVTDYVIECYNDKGEMRVRSIARVTPNFDKYQPGYLTFTRSGDNVLLSWNTPNVNASYCFLTRGQEPEKSYLVNPSGSLSLPLSSSQNDFFTLDCFNSNDYLVFQTYTDTTLVSSNASKCASRGEYIFYNPALGDITVRCCSGLVERKLTEDIGICQ